MPKSAFNGFTGNEKATVVKHDGVKYHDTWVVKFDNGTMTLDTGGWPGYYTKYRMNQAFSHYDINFHVYQENHQWFVVVPGQEIWEDKSNHILFVEDAREKERDVLTIDLVTNEVVE